MTETTTTTYGQLRPVVVHQTALATLDAGMEQSLLVDGTRWPLHYDASLNRLLVVEGGDDWSPFRVVEITPDGFEYPLFSIEAFEPRVGEFVEVETVDFYSTWADAVLDIVIGLPDHDGRIEVC